MSEWMSDEPMCEHGNALDVHCCECKRSGFFPPDPDPCLRMSEERLETIANMRERPYIRQLLDDLLDELRASRKREKDLEDHNRQHYLNENFLGREIDKHRSRIAALELAQRQINADHAWGCPDCVGEMRCKISNLEGEIKLLREFEAGARSDNGEAEMLAATAKLDEFRRKRGE